MSEDLPKSTATDENEMDVDVEDEEVFNDNADGAQQPINNEEDEEDKENGKDETSGPGMTIPELPEFTRKDKTLHEILEMMEDYYPIVSSSKINRNDLNHARN